MAPVEAPAGALLAVQVAYAPAPETMDLSALQLRPGATVSDALQASGLLQRHGLALNEELVCGVWSKIRPLDHALRDGDRVEVYRPLRVDPKEARRQRYRKTNQDGKTKARRAVPAAPTTDPEAR